MNPKVKIIGGNTDCYWKGKLFFPDTGAFLKALQCKDIITFGKPERYYMDLIIEEQYKYVQIDLKHFCMIGDTIDQDMGFA